MPKKSNVFSSFIIMLCLGSIYAWSIFVPELKESFQLSTAQTQLIFGTVIGVFTLTMTRAARLLVKHGPSFVATLSGVFYLLGFVIAFLSKGNFFVMWLGIGLLGGIGTGLGYLVSLSVPVKWYPRKRGFVTGIVVAGFGAGAIILTYVSEHLLKQGMDVLSIFLLQGVIYGLIILLSAQRLSYPEGTISHQEESTTPKKNGAIFTQLVFGIFAGTFTGLLVIGNLKPIGHLHNISALIIPLSISLFSFANFVGRIYWGWLSDRIKNIYLIPTSLIIQGATSLALFLLPVSDTSFIGLVILLGFSFGAHFVLFAKDTINKFGLGNYEKIYPYIFLGYGFAGIAGPSIGGWVFDLTGNYLDAIILAAVLSVVATLVYILIDKGIKYKKEELSAIE